jgi:hypothetical protein
MIIPLFSGIFLKLYDDIHDNNIEISSDQKELLKVLIVCFFTVWFMLDLGCSFLFVIISIACYFLKQIDNEFWRACMTIPFITTFTNYNKFQFIGLIDFIERIGYILAFTFGIFVESNMFPEEFSINKLLFRLLIIILGIVVLHITQFFSSRNFIYSMTYFVIGYNITSVLGNLYKIHDPTILNKLLNTLNNK